MTAGYEGGKAEMDIVRIDRLIHEPSRFVIMAHLCVVDSADFVFLIRHTGMTWGNLSAHLSKLEDAGYVAVEKEFLNKKPHTMLRLTERGRVAFDGYRNRMRSALDNLPAE